MLKRIGIGLIAIAVLAIGLAIYLCRPVHVKKVPVILGHGGMGVRSMLPINSYRSINKALSFPIDGTEMDVKITPDGVLVAFHDQELEKCTNCKGNVASTLYTDLENCRYSSLLYPEKISSLREILESPYPDSTVFSFDLKLDPQIEGESISVLVTVLRGLINEFPQYLYLIESQSLIALDELKYWKTPAKLFYYGHRPSSAIQLAMVHQFDGISMEMDLIDSKEVEGAKQSGLKVMLWGTGSVFSNRKILQLQPDIIQTDDIRSMVYLLDRD